MILLFGFGGVGRTYAELLYQKTSLRLCAVFDSGGGVGKKDGFTWEEVKKLLKAPRGAVSKSGVGRQASVDEALDFCQVVVDVSPPNYDTGEPSLSLYKKAFSKGLAVVTANKAPLALRFRELASGGKIFYKATVMAGTPLVDLLKGLPPQEVEYVRGILNGSTNYVMTRVYKDGISFEKAVEEAKERGILEPDPRLDLEGLDAAAKLTIIANTLGVGMTLHQVAREPLRPLGPVTRYVAYFDKAGNAWVKPLRLPPDDPLHVDYIMNAVEIKTEVNTILVKGKGAGRVETAHVLINDILKALYNG